VRSDASGQQNVDALFFMLRGAECGPQKKDVGTCHQKTCDFASSAIRTSCLVRSPRSSSSVESLPESV
jgi:hypothetical protein